MTKKDGFFIINNRPYTDNLDFKRNAYDITRLSKIYSKNKYYWLDSNEWMKDIESLKYIVGIGDICIDCDTKEAVDLIEKLCSLLDIKPYSYYSTESKGKKHFWFKVPEKYQQIITHNKLNSSSNKFFDNVDTRSCRVEAKGRIVGGAVFLRHREKPESSNRPTPFDLIDNLSKLTAKIPLILLIDRKDLDWEKCVAPHKSGKEKFYQFIFKAAKHIRFLFKGWDDKYIFANWIQYITSLCGINDWDPGLTKDEILDTWENSKKVKYTNDKTGITEYIKPDIQNKKVQKNIKFYNRKYWFYSSNLNNWINLTAKFSSDLEVRKYMKNRLGYNIKELYDAWESILYNVQRDCVESTELTQAKNPIFTNGYFDENMKFILIDDDNIPPFSKFIIQNEYKYLSRENYNPEVMKWLIPFFGSEGKMNDFFTCISPALSDKSNVIWITLFQPNKGESGKSALQQLIKKAIGIDNSCKCDLANILGKTNFSTRGMVDKTFAYTEENADRITPKQAEYVKSLCNVTNSEINYDAKYDNRFSITNTFSWLSSTNSIPIVPILDEAFLSRMVYYKVDRVKEKLNFDLINSHEALSTIINLLVEGYKRWAKTDYLNRNTLSKINDNKEIIITSMRDDIIWEWFKDNKEVENRYLYFDNYWDTLTFEDQKHRNKAKEKNKFNKFKNQLTLVHDYINLYGDTLDNINSFA